MRSTRHGCLVIADIGGYTRYLSGVELEHSTDILADLLQTVVDALQARFTVAKVEGDAVFAYDEGQADGAVLVDAVTGAYMSFMRRRRTVTQLTTCPCDACSSIVDLGLKVVAHRGDFATHEIAGGTELVGRDVILVHRLLKNDITGRTGIADYALYTEALVGEFALKPAALGWRTDRELYEDVGEVEIHLDDLGARWRGHAAAAKHLIPESAGATVVWELPAPPPVVWEQLAHPDNVVRFMADEARQTSPTGARGPGMATHCVHGSQSFDLEVLDWIPYEFQASRFRSRGITFLYNATYEQPEPGKTRLTARIAPLEAGMASVLFPLVKRRIRKQYESWMRSLEDLLLREGGEATRRPAPAAQSSPGALFASVGRAPDDRSTP